MEEQNKSKRKKTRHLQEDPHKLTSIKDAGIVRGILGKFENIEKERTGRNATGRKEVTGRKDSVRKRKKVLQYSNLHLNETPGIENTSCTRRLNFNSNFPTSIKANFEEKEKEKLHFKEKGQIYDVNCPKLVLSDENGRNKGDTVDLIQSISNIARTEEERQKGRK